MRKIEVYENFNNHLGAFFEADLLVNALNESAEEALNREDWRIVDMIAYGNKRYEWAWDATEKEKLGEHVIPEYIWDGAARFLTKMAERLDKEVLKLKSTAPYTKADKKLRNKRNKIDRRLRNQKINTMRRKLLTFKKIRLLDKWEEIRKWDCSLFFCQTDGLDLNTFTKVYLNGKYTLDEDLYPPAYRDLASKLISYAQQLRQADL